ncbi:hypothetical protein VAB18032_15920 [Micromonospora maris AB-18-032]|nr:hypothetical protein VAB18032_15920 [Micromonospora maris AB-18-032]
MGSIDLTAGIWAVHVIYGMPARWGPGEVHRFGMAGAAY